MDWPFSRLVKCFEVISTPTTSRDLKKDQFSRLLGEWKNAHLPLTSHEGYLFSLVRLVMPRSDNERKYGLQEAALGNLLIQVVGIDSGSPDAEALRAWSTDKTNKADKTDFGETAQRLIEARSSVGVDEAKMTVGELNQYLDRLSRTAAESNSKQSGASQEIKKERSQIFEFFFSNCTALEQKWIFRLILKDMKFGVADQTLMQCLHPDAPRLYQYKTNLRTVCMDVEKLATSSGSSSLIKLSLFSPFMPMKLSKTHPNSVPRLMHDQPFWMEEKLDGHRIILHFFKDQFRYFGREGIDHTHHYGATASEKLSKRIYPLLNKDARVQKMILDGEMLVWDPVYRIYQPFGSLASFTNKEDDQIDENTPRPCFVVFDLLMVNDNEMTQINLKKRREWLSKVVKEEEGTLMILPYTEGKTTADVIDKMEEILKSRGEGIVVKDPASLYLPGMRINTWLKIKPDFISHLGEHVDLVIVGVTRGKGSRSCNFSSFTCAVRCDVENALSPPQDPTLTRWASVCRVGIGFSQHMLDKFTEEFSRHCISSSDLSFPEWLDPDDLGFQVKFKDIPDFWLPPWKSVVLQVKSSELVTSDTCGSRICMRFPRVYKVRDDKPWWDASTLKFLQNLFTSTKDLKSHLVRLEGDNITESRAGGGNSSGTSTSKQLDVVKHQMVAIDVDKVKVDADIFKQMEFCVLSESDSLSKKELEEMIVKLGGTVVANPRKETKYVVIGKLNFRAKKYVELKQPSWDVINTKWINDCHEKKFRIPMQPKYLLNPTEETRESVFENMDKYGDSYTELVTPESLQVLLDSMQTEPEDTLTQEEVRNFILSHGLFEDETIHDLFLFPLVFHFYHEPNETNNEQLDNSMEEDELMKILAELYGALIAETVDNPDITHIIVTNSEDMDQCLEDISLKHSDKRPIVVSEEWLRKCIEEKMLVNEEDYQNLS